MLHLNSTQDFMAKQIEHSSGQTIDQLNQSCYDQQFYLWDRFPFPDILPGWIKNYFPSSLKKTALDVGSGTGRLAYWLKEEGFTLLCLDPSPQMASLCREKGLPTLQATIQSYQPSQKFSLVCAILSLIHVPKKELPDQLAKIASLLPSKGIFLLALISGKGEGIEETNSPYPRFFAKYADKEIQPLLTSLFKLLETRKVKGPGGITYLLFALQKK